MCTPSPTARLLSLQISESVEPSGWSQPINVDGFDQVAVQVPQGKALSGAVSLAAVPRGDLDAMHVILRVHIIRNAAVSCGLAVVVTSQTKMMVPTVQVCACLCVWGGGGKPPLG
jgi:hypothetical protein